ncbi:MAG: hypothetical protein JSR82_13930 [Verrucomicrobia bacterium]|nr:hypothetical protein [Verrucomicrobiota bacterium]
MNFFRLWACRACDSESGGELRKRLLADDFALVLVLGPAQALVLVLGRCPCCWAQFSPTRSWSPKLGCGAVSNTFPPTA